MAGGAGASEIQELRKQVKESEAKDQKLAEDIEGLSEVITQAAANVEAERIRLKPEVDASAEARMGREARMQTDLSALEIDLKPEKCIGDRLRALAEWLPRFAFGVRISRRGSFHQRPQGHHGEPQVAAALRISAVGRVRISLQPSAPARACASLALASLEPSLRFAGGEAWPTTGSPSWRVDWKRLEPELLAVRRRPNRTDEEEEDEAEADEEAEAEQGGGSRKAGSRKCAPRPLPGA